MELSTATQAWESSGQRVDVGEGLEAWVCERGKGPAMFFLHGFPTSSYDWRGVIDALSADYRCVALDFIGYGLSDKPAAWSYSIFQQADVAEAVALALGIEQAHVVSHDVGTSVHTEFLAREREGRLGFEITASTFLNGSMLQDIATITPFQELLASNKTLPQAIAICENMGPAYIDGLKTVMKRPECLTEEDELVMTELMAREDGNLRMPSLSLYMRERYIHKDRWIGALRETEKPLQFVWADGDPVANVTLGRALHAECPQARYTELPGLGHFLLMEDPAAVGTEIARVTSDGTS